MVQARRWGKAARGAQIETKPINDETRSRVPSVLPGGDEEHSRITASTLGGAGREIDLPG